MSLSDPLGDMLTRIRNGQLRNKESVLMPASRFRANVLEVLHREGYIRGFKKIELEKNKNNFQIELKYKAWIKKFKLFEHPIIFKNRVLGKSKMSSNIIWEALFGVLFLRLNKQRFK